VSTLLVVDGDSFAHRAYHALPKSIRLNAVVGFTNMLVRLWQAEQPEAVLVAWDTLSVPTYRHEAFEPYQSGRVFEESILEQLEILPEVVSAFVNEEFRNIEKYILNNPVKVGLPRTPEDYRWSSAHVA